MGIDTNEFIDQLASASPRGLPHGKSRDWYVEQNAESYMCERRVVPLAFSGIEGSEELLELFGRWDPSTIHVGNFDFLEQPLPIAEGLQVGAYLLDPIVIVRSGELAVFDQMNSNLDPSLYVAENGNKYLEALLISARHLARCYADGVPCDETIEESKAAAFASAEAAGGAKYLKIYLDNFGVCDDEEDAGD